MFWTGFLSITSSLVLYM